MSEPPRAGPRGLITPELEKELHAAFDSVRAKNKAPGTDRGRGADGLRTKRAHRDGFLFIEHQRRALATRLEEPARPSRRYCNLLLITKVIRLEHELLGGRVGRSNRAPSLGLGSDVPARWAQPWGVAPMFELRAALQNYSRRRDRLARRLPAGTRARAAAEAKREMNRISSHFARVAGGLRLVEDEPAPAPRRPARKPAPRPARKRERRRREPAGERKTAEKRRRRPSPMLIRTAGIAVAAVPVAVIISVIQSDPPSDSTSTLSLAPASVSAHPLPPSGGAPDSQPARDQGPKPDQRRQPSKDRDTGTNQPAPEPEQAELVASQEPLPAPEPVSEAPAPKPTPPKKPPKPTPPKPTPPASGPAPAPAPAPAPEPAPAPAPPPEIPPEPREVVSPSTP